ncbi:MULTISPECIES: DUF488 domain-containing protein [Streptomyces]|uniref:DUF488 domain-containing protein n=1 Tax=Streptomyces TaxID=1883 RepID=UPI000B88EED1|nr:MULTISPECIES: DUF488 family protein [unclassified Streptomyces]MYQ50088.1 DUF488 family protein [Streptomyces sp. SID4941]
MRAVDDAVRVRRVYDPPEKDDGTRVLVDRLWPRGVSKEHAAVDVWAKEAAPSKELRSWYHQDPDGRFDDFVDRYRTELDDSAHRDAVEELAALLRGDGPVTFVTAVREVGTSQVPVLVEHLEHVTGRR